MTRVYACLTAVAALLLSCRAAPEAIVAGEDHCGRCRMQIADARFAAEAITEKGRVVKFDSVSCLVGYLAEAEPRPARVLVSDFLHPDSLIPVEKARFLRMRDLNGPMGPAVIASADEAGLRKLRETQKGEEVGWDELRRSAR